MLLPCLYFLAKFIFLWISCLSSYSNLIHALRDVSYVHALQVKKLIKEKKDDPEISEYLDMEKELQEVSQFSYFYFTLWCPCACINYPTDTLSFCCFNAKLLIILTKGYDFGTVAIDSFSSLLQGALPSKVAWKGSLQQKIYFWGI